MLQADQIYLEKTLETSKYKITSIKTANKWLILTKMLHRDPRAEEVSQERGVQCAGFTRAQQGHPCVNKVTP